MAAGVLNEVLSLNAQECVRSNSVMLQLPVLNEVLSLNAQEWLRQNVRSEAIRFLNEVLSLNAQECRPHHRNQLEKSSSMKS